MPVRQTLTNIDRRLPAPGWKSAITGLVAAFFPWVNAVLGWLGQEPIPAEVIQQTQTLLGVLVAFFMLLKANRPKQYDGRKP